MHVPQAYCTDDVSSLFNSLNTPYRCGTNTVEDGIKNKIAAMGDESQIKLQDTMQKIVNDSNGGIVCIII